MVQWNHQFSLLQLRTRTLNWQLKNHRSSWGKDCDIHLLFVRYVFSFLHLVKLKAAEEKNTRNATHHSINQTDLLPELGKDLPKKIINCIRLVTVRISDPFLILTPHLLSLWYLYFKATITLAAGRRTAAAGRFNCFCSFGAGMASGTTSSAISLSEQSSLPPPFFFFFGVLFLALDLALAFTAVDPDFVFTAAGFGGVFFDFGFAEGLLFGVFPLPPFSADLRVDVSSVASPSPPFFSSRGGSATDWASGASSSSESWSSSPVGMMLLRDFGRWSNLEPWNYMRFGTRQILLAMHQAPYRAFSVVFWQYKSTQVRKRKTFPSEMSKQTLKK